MKILITICARGGSKGIPHKNIKHLNGKPLIEYSIRIAEKVKELYPESIIEVSSDDLEIIDVVHELGIATKYKRPDFLATDSAGKVDAINDLVKYSERYYKMAFDLVLDLDVSSPLRTIDDITSAITEFNAHKDALTLFSVSTANKNPYFNMVERNEAGYYELSKSLNNITLSRQAAPEVLELNASFYLYRREFFDLNLKGVITNKSIVYKMDHICFDLDHPIDFDFLNFLVLHKKLDFDLL